MTKFFKILGLSLFVFLDALVPYNCRTNRPRYQRYNIVYSVNIEDDSSSYSYSRICEQNESLSDSVLENIDIDDLFPDFPHESYYITSWLVSMGESDAGKINWQNIDFPCTLSDDMYVKKYDVYKNCIVFKAVVEKVCVIRDEV